MNVSSVRLTQIILDTLGDGERRELSMVVAVRHVLSRSGPMKGDLTTSMKAALRKLVAAGTVQETDGTYFLSPHCKKSKPGVLPADIKA